MLNLCIQKIEQPEIKNMLKAEILYRAGLLQ
jgi:hypothetical protein